MLAYSKTYFLEHISENTPLPPPKKNTTYHQVFKKKFDEET